MVLRFKNQCLLSLAVQFRIKGQSASVCGAGGGGVHPGRRHLAGDMRVLQGVALLGRARSTGGLTYSYQSMPCDGQPHAVRFLTAGSPKAGVAALLLHCFCLQCINVEVRQISRHVVATEMF